MDGGDGEGEEDCREDAGVVWDSPREEEMADVRVARRGFGALFLAGLRPERVSAPSASSYGEFIAIAIIEVVNVGEPK